MRVLFVCLGNICRSPLAEAILRRDAERRGVTCEVDSAGVGAWHIGNKPDARAIVAGRSHGLDLTGMAARQLSLRDLEDFDWILALDSQNLRDIRALAGGKNDRIRLLGEFGGTETPEDVADPYYSGRFEPAIAQIERCVSGFLDHVSSEQ